MKTAPKSTYGLETQSQSTNVECVWMTAGVVQYKLCDREFECESCPFDKGFRDAALLQRKHGASGASQLVAKVTAPIAELANIEGYDVAGALFYSVGHVWVRVEDHGRVRLGLDDFGQRLTGRIYSVSFPHPGSTINQRSQDWSITHKAGRTTIGSPVEGTIVKVNHALLERPANVNRDPYGDGWMVIVQPLDLDQSLKELAYGKSARTFLALEAENLNREINQLAWPLRPQVGATMADGGVRIPDFTHLFAADQQKRLIDSFLSNPTRRFEDTDSAMNRKGR